MAWSMARLSGVSTSRGLGMGRYGFKSFE
jgi:hypothetical protein